jgi:hypothetical protein
MWGGVFTGCCCSKSNIMVDSGKASIRVWNKYIGDPNPKGVHKKLRIQFVIENGTFLIAN